MYVFDGGVVGTDDHLRKLYARRILRVDCCLRA